MYKDSGNIIFTPVEQEQFGVAARTTVAGAYQDADCFVMIATMLEANCIKRVNNYKGTDPAIISSVDRDMRLSDRLIGFAGQIFDICIDDQSAAFVLD